MRQPLRRLVLALALAAAAPVVSPTVARADPPAPQAQRQVRVEAVLVRATRGGPHLDPALQPFAQDLRALPYDHFDRVAAGAWSAAPGGRAEGALGDLRITISVEEVSDQGATLVVDLTRDGRRITRTTVQRPWGRAHVLTAGSDGGAALVVPVRVVR